MLVVDIKFPEFGPAAQADVKLGWPEVKLWAFILVVPVTEVIPWELPTVNPILPSAEIAAPVKPWLGNVDRLIL